MTSESPADREIAKVILDEWERSGRPLLTSRLGMRLTADTKAELSASGHGLKRYIQENLSDVVRIVPLRGRGGGVAPIVETENLTDQQIEERFVSRPDVIDSRFTIPKYWGDVWRGFQTPLPENAVRYILLEAFGGPVVQTTSKDASMPPNAKLIDTNDLVLPEANGPLPPKIAVHRSIENWCLRESVPIGSLVYSRPENSTEGHPGAVEAQRSTNKTATGGRSDRSSFLMQGLNLLNRDELSRINIPADLVLTMLERANSR